MWVKHFHKPSPSHHHFLWVVSWPFPIIFVVYDSQKMSKSTMKMTPGLKVAQCRRNIYPPPTGRKSSTPCAKLQRSRSLEQAPVVIKAWHLVIGPLKTEQVFTPGFQRLVLVCLKIVCTPKLNGESSCSFIFPIQWLQLEIYPISRHTNF